MAAVNGSIEHSDAIVRLAYQSWSASGDYLQYFWEHKVLPFTGVDPWSWYFVVIGFWMNYVYHLAITGFFSIVDVTQKPHFIYKYKVQPGTNEQLSWGKIFQILKVVLINQTLVVWPLMFIGYTVRKLRPAPDIYTLPAFSEFLLQIGFSVVADDLGYYVLHRFILHNPLFYKHLHKKHHELKATIAISTLYCHPIENAVNLGTVAIGPLVCQMHFATLLCWVWFSSTLPVHNHLGYEIPYLFFLFPPASKHDFHHELPVNEMYGKNSIFDRLLGTDQRWRLSMAKKMASEKHENKYGKVVQPYSKDD